VKIMEKKQSKARKFLFGFEDFGAPDCNKETLGGKGFGLVDRHGMGVPVPPAKILSTELCRIYKKDPDTVRAYLKNEAIPQILSALRKLDGSSSLFSVRSGAKVSMPGMMDTILNVGLTKANLPAWESKIGARAARDCRRRLLQMYGTVVCGIDGSKFESEIANIKTKRRVVEDRELDAADMMQVITAFEKVLKKERVVVPESLEEQILAASEAVLKSWDNSRAKEYRKIRGFSDEWGTAIVVQEMVFGNLNEQSCSGVVFSRNPALGNNEPMGDFLANAQGEDVVAGVRDPDPIYKMKDWNPVAYKTLMDITERLERESKEVQDIEFTVESGVVYILQTRSAQMSALATMKIAVEMSKSGLITKAEALNRVSLEQYEQLCMPMISPTFKGTPDVLGLAASTGIASGKVVFSSEAAVDHVGDCMLLAEETTPEDLPGMHAARGILTATGGVTSHAAVVARGMDKVCVVGASEVKFIKNAHGEIQEAKIGIHTVREGDTLTLDGATGRVWVGTSVPVVPGGELPVMLDFNEMIYEVFPVYRIVTDGRDLNMDIPSVFATYLLDGLTESRIRQEIKDSLPYLNGVIDLSTLEEHAPKEDAEILSLGGSTKDDEVFRVKCDAVLSYGGERGSVRVHLGRRHSDVAERFKRSGFDVVEPSGLASGGQGQSVFTICSGAEPATAAILKATVAGQSKAVVAAASVPFAVLEDLAGQRADGHDVSPILAMSVPQILSSIKRKVSL
jgi:pyruvate,phosphate dikinase